MMNDTSQCVFFYGGPLSQWYPSPFVLDGVPYTTAEQYMMACKARVFGDQDTLHKILQTANPREQKALGRQVQGFDPEVWNRVARNLVIRGNVAKFGQSIDLRLYLLNTGDKELVEASQTDCFWGIGLGLDSPLRYDRSAWRGTNWLGLALMAARTVLRAES